MTIEVRGADHRHGGRGGNTLRRTSLAAVLALVALLMATPVANANYTWWRTGALGAGQADADLTRTNLYSSRAYADYDRYAQAGAHYPGGWTLYGGYAQALNEVCQNYPGLNLGAMVRNPHTVTQSQFWALSGWGSPGYC